MEEQDFLARSNKRIKTWEISGAGDGTSRVVEEVNPRMDSDRQKTSYRDSIMMLVLDGEK